MIISELITKQWSYDIHRKKFSAGLDIDLNSWGFGVELGLPKPNNWKFYFGMQILCIAFYIGAS